MIEKVTEKDLQFLYDYYRGPVFMEWLDSVEARGQGHGSELVIALGSPWKSLPGLMDNVAAAQRWLTIAEQVGWIERVGKISPTREQRFFNVNESYRYNPESSVEAFFWVRSRNKTEPA